MSLQPWSWQIFRLDTTVVAIFPNVCLWRRSLCSNVVLTLKKMYRATFICQYGLCCWNMALVSFRLFRKNLSNLRDSFGQMVYHPAPALPPSQPARAFYCKRARHCIVGNNNAPTHNKPYTCHKSTAWAPTAQRTRAKRTNAIPDWLLTTETGNGLCESLNKGPLIWLLRRGGGGGLVTWFA